MPNALTLLEHDHREVERLFSQFRSTGDHSIAMKICEELTVHSTVEEEIVYPELRRIDTRLEQEAEKEHDEAKALIAQIQAMEPDDDRLAQKVEALERSVQHHVQEEESEAFPKMREQAAGQLETMGQAVQSRKQELQKGSSGATATKQELVDLTRDELYSMAQEQEIPGRSSMTKDQLVDALAKR